MPEPVLRRLAGILLAGGKGARFDPSGSENKLSQLLPGEHGERVGAVSARALLTAVPTVLAVVRPQVDALAAQLRDAGCAVAVCPDAENGMGATLAFAVSQLADADGWIIALADMPYVQPTTLAALADALHNGADIVVPLHAGQRGNPVGFSRRHLAHLLALHGDQGARGLLKTCPVVEVVVDDAGVLRDIDIPVDLQ